MKLFLKIIIIFFYSFSISAVDNGETEISTDNGIEVYQNEKFYLLKKNVKIKSESFSLNANDVKVNFNESLYDITELNANGDVDFKSVIFNMEGNGELLRFEVKNEKLKIEGIGSKIITEDIEMFSDGFIIINNLNGEFSLKGPNSKLENDNILIKSKSIDGVFTNNDNKKEIIYLNIIDDKLSYIKNKDTEMYAKKINFNNNNSTIELIDSVTIIRNNEKITGDYGTLDTSNNSYKIKSNNQNKVKIIIKNNE